jgi:tight adherence protein B
MKIERRHIEILAPLVLLAAAGLMVNIFAGIAAGVLVYAAPKIIERRKAAERKEKFAQELVDAIDIIANSLRSGLTFQQALSVLKRDIPEPMAGEIKKVLNKHQLGLSMEKALLEMAEENKNESLELFVTAVVLVRETGGNLVEVLKKVSESIREKNRLEGHIKVLTAQGKLSGWIVGILPFLMTFIIYMMDPELVTPLFTTFIGILLVTAALIMELLGVFFIRKIVNVEV